MAKISLKNLVVLTSALVLSGGAGFTLESPKQIELDLNSASQKTIQQNVINSEGLSIKDKFEAKEKNVEIRNSSSSSSSVFNSAVDNAITIPFDKVKKTIMK